MSFAESFPPVTAPPDKARYRQFLIDHGLDPNLNAEDLGRAFAEQSDAERRQLQSHWTEFAATL